MATKKAGTGNWKMYVSVVCFSFVWVIISQIISITTPMDNSWDNFILNLPDKLSALDLSTKELSSTFLFGKYYNKPVHPKVSITALDEHTLEKYGWPVRRRYYAEVVTQLKKLGVKSVGVDVLLFEPDRDFPENDRKYVEAVAKAGNVVNLIGIDVSNLGIKKPIKGLPEASAIVAHPHVDISMDSDGMVRRYWPFYPTRFIGETERKVTYADTGLKNLRCGKECAELDIPSLGIATYALYSGKKLSELLKEYDSEKMLNYRYVQDWPEHPGWDNPPQKKALSSYRWISARDIIEGKLSPAEKECLNGGITFIGATALGAFDHVPNPFLKLFPGVEVHATFIDNLLSNDFRRPVPTDYVLLLIFLLPWVPVLLRKFPLNALVGTCVSIIAGFLVLDIVLRAHNIVMPFFTITGPFLFPFAYITIDKGLAEGREKKWIKSTFGQYLSPKVVEIITKDPSKLSLGGEKRDMTAFFLDIAGFTTISEKLTPDQLTKMMNTYLSGFTDVILRHDGVVDKYIGDCIMAFWNAPLDQKDHRKLACLAAIDCLAELHRLNESSEFSIKPDCRIGLNSGFMVVGNMGSNTRMSYTVMGDTVNLASRLEGANKYFHSKIMVSEYTYEEAKDSVEARLLGQVRVVGKAIPVKVYELLGKKGGMDAKTAKLAAHYNDGLDHFYKGAYDKAQTALKAALEVEPKDGPSAFYLALAEKYAVSVPKDWDGTFNLTSK